MYIVIDNHGAVKWINICTNENGENIIFDEEADAELYAKEECHNGIVVEVN